MADELTPAEAQDETEDDAMLVDLDALADRINNAPAYGNYNFDHITDNMLEPEDGNGEDDDEDNTEGHEYDEEKPLTTPSMTPMRRRCELYKQCIETSRGM